jgi:hypothetical protein
MSLLMDKRKQNGGGKRRRRGIGLSLVMALG